MISAILLGILTGFLLAVPVGPINLTVIHESLDKGFERGFLVGLGGIVADTLYCALAFLGFSSMLDDVKYLWPFFQFMGGFVALLIGMRFALLPEKDYVPVAKKSDSTIAHFGKAFPLGFFLGISNPSLFILWGGVNTLFISHGWLSFEKKLVTVCIIGIAIGSLLWFFLVSLFVSRVHYQVGSAVATRVTRGCGLLLIFLGAVLCTKSWLR